MGTQHTAQSTEQGKPVWSMTVCLSTRTSTQHAHTYTCSAHVKTQSYIHSHTQFHSHMYTEMSQIKTNLHACKATEDDVNFGLRPLKEQERERGKWEHQRKRERYPERMSKRRERDHSLSFFVRADWEPARSRETMTTRQPTLATNPAFSQSESDRRLSKG